MTQHVIRVLDDGRYHVGRTELGRDWTPIGVSFKAPRDAVDFVDRLAASRSASEVARQGIDEGQASGADQDVSGRPTTPAVASIPPLRGGRPIP